MNTLRRNWNKAGYDQEEAFFFKKDRELIEQSKEKGKGLRLIQGGAPRQLLPPSPKAAKKAA